MIHVKKTTEFRDGTGKYQLWYKLDDGMVTIFSQGAVFINLYSNKPITSSDSYFKAIEIVEKDSDWAEINSEIKELGDSTRLVVNKNAHMPCQMTYKEFAEGLPIDVPKDDEQLDPQKDVRVVMAGSMENSVVFVARNPDSKGCRVFQLGYDLVEEYIQNIRPHLTRMQTTDIVMSDAAFGLVRD